MKTYTFEQITDQEYKGAHHILFTLNNFSYRLRIFKPYLRDSFVIEPIKHNDRGFCPCCGKKAYLSICEVLQLDKQNIFEQLMSVNHLRLTWLFRNCLWEDEI